VGNDAIALVIDELVDKIETGDNTGEEEEEEEELL